MSAVSARLFAVLLGLALPVAARAQESAPPAPPADEATAVSDVFVKAPPTEVPVPDVGRGAPVLSSAQTRAMVFDARATSGGFPGAGGTFRSADEWLGIARITNAHNATEEAERVRREAAQGLRTQAEVEFAELRRQGALSGAGIFYARAPKLEDLVYPPTAAVLEDAKVRFADDGVGRLLIVSGVMRNTTPGKSDAPSLLVTVVDPLGFITGERAMAPRFDLESGQSRPFVFFFRVPPIYLREVRLALVDPKSPPPRALPGPPPSEGDTVEVSRLAAMSKFPEMPIPLVGQGAPAYTAEDLRRLRLALGQRQPASTVSRDELDLIRANGGALGDPAALLAAQQATETARVSRRQAVMGRRTQKEVEETELARQAAVLAAVGPVRPVIHDLTPVVAASTSVGNLRAELMPVGGRGLLRVSGTIRNAAGLPASRPLTVQMLDAQGFVLAQRTVDPRTALSGRGRPPARQVPGSFDFALADPPKHIEAVRVVAP